MTDTDLRGLVADLLPTLRAFAIPMPVRFRGTTLREGALLHGPAWGEFSPFGDYGPRECARWLSCALEAAGQGWPAPVRSSIPVNVTVPAVGPEQAHAIVARSGCRTAKVKVAEPGEPESADIARVEAVRDAIGADGKVRVDANGGWDVDTAERVLTALARFDLEYAEQPCATLGELAALRRRVDVPLAADESIRRAEDPLAVRATGAADIVVLKAQPLGGVRTALEVADACGLPVVVSSAVESSVGLAAGAALAAALPELPYACGLATMSLLAGDVTDAPLAESGGELPVRAAVVDPGQLARWEVDPVGWRDRLLAAAEFLPAAWLAGWAAVNPSTAFATVLVDELMRCGLQEAVIAPGSRSAPLAMALHAAASAPNSPLRLHVRIDERSASFLALGLAKASGRPAAVVCTSGTAAAHVHAAVIEADEACVPLLVLTADRPPELRGTGANQTIDQVKLYGGAVRWFCEPGVGEYRTGQVGYWRSVASRAWSLASGNGVASAGPVHVNVQFRDPLVPEAGSGWPEPLDGRADGAPWTRAWFLERSPLGTTGSLPEVELGWTERGLVLCGDGTANPQSLAELAAAAGWPLLAEPSSGARHGAAALRSYEYLLDSADFLAAHRPDLIISAGRPGLSRGQLALLGCAALTGSSGATRHVVLGQPDGRWADPARTATDVASSVRVRHVPASSDVGWLDSWRRADAAASEAADSVLDTDPGLSEPLLARDLGAALPAGALLWVASSMRARDLDRHLAPRADLRILANRGASGIDGMVSSAIGAALAHQRAGSGPAVALLGDLALLHDAPGLMIGPVEPRPDLCLIVVNNNGGGIFSGLEQAAFPDPFERVFGTPHDTDFSHVAAAAGLPYLLVRNAAELPGALVGRGLRLVEVRTDRAEQSALRTAVAKACAAATEGA